MRLREQLRAVQAELDQLYNHRSERSPWWAFCLRPGAGGAPPGGFQGGEVQPLNPHGRSLTV